MWLDLVSNQGPLALESDTLPTVPRGVARMWHLIRVNTVGFQDFYGKYNKSNKRAPEYPKTRNGLIQIMRMDKSTGQERIKVVSLAIMLTHMGVFIHLYLPSV